MSTAQPKVVWSSEVTEMMQNFGKKCVIGLDRDGVLNVDRGTYTYKPEQFEPIPGSLEAVAKLRRMGHKIVIITNQGGIEHGLFTEEDVD